MSKRRVFFALWPDVRQRDRLRDAINSVARNVEGRAVDRRNWHITLAFAGDVEDTMIPTLLQRAADIPVEPFRLHFDRLEFWPRPKIAALVAMTVPAELETLVAQLNSLLQDLGIVTEDRTYRPHITVSRNARNFAVERLAQRTTTEWSGFELIESLSGPGGASYVPLKQ